jgi:hypothetical protein
LVPWGQTSPKWSAQSSPADFGQGFLGTRHTAVAELKHHHDHYHHYLHLLHFKKILSDTNLNMKSMQTCQKMPEVHGFNEER